MCPEKGREIWLLCSPTTSSAFSESALCPLPVEVKKSKGIVKRTLFPSLKVQDLEFHLVSGPMVLFV